MKQESLFKERNTPLAASLRPKTLDEIIGQSTILAKGAPLRALIESKKLSSIILWGPAGTGKTTIARVIASTGDMKFISLNASSASVKDIRREGDLALSLSTTSVIFIDEIHRFSKTQQDTLLPYVEEGILILIGATTENPYHSINSSLISRSHIFQLEPLTKKDLIKVILRGVEYYREQGRSISLNEDVVNHIVIMSCGDARKALTILELAINTSKDDITLNAIRAVAPSKYMILGDSDHFDMASAYQGSIQASDPDAAVFWLAKWLESGEDPRYIARRMLVSAAEDGFSDPMCIVVAQAAYTAAAEIGRPECDIVLSAATILIAKAKRDKSAAMAIWAALKDVRQNLDVAVPKEMRDCHYAGAKQLGFGAYADGAKQSKYVGVNKIYYIPW